MQTHDPMTLRPARLSECRGPGVLLAFREAEENFLIVGEEAPVAIFVDAGERAWRSLPVADGAAHTGLLVGDVRIEVDIQSSFDPDERMPAGALIRHGDTLLIWTRGSLLPLAATGEPLTIVAGESGGNSVSVGFSRWNVVKGEGAEKKVILKIDAAGKKDEGDDGE